MPHAAARQNARHRLASLGADCNGVATPFLLLLLGLALNHWLSNAAPMLWMLLPLGLSAVLCRVRPSDIAVPTLRLWQLIGVYSAIYSLLHYPLLPLAAPDTVHGLLYALLLLTWLTSLGAGVLCFRLPSLALIPPSVLAWSNAMAGAITGLPTTTYLDVQPLPEISICLGLGVLILQGYHRRPRREPFLSRAQLFAALLPLIAISIHLANYFWSFIAKMRLHGPFASWVTDNNPAYIFLVALDDQHVIFSGFPALVQFVYFLADHLHAFSNVLILIIQATAIIIWLFPKRMLVLLLLAFDAMHLAILFVAGANFWPWIILNVIITAVVARRDFKMPSLNLRLIAMAFIIISPLFVFVARLGWYDTGANNKLFFQAIDENGRRYDVPANFFTFYSYSFGHMDYGPPQPGSAFAVQSPNGGAGDFATFKAGRSCDVRALVRPGTEQSFDAEKMSGFIRAYHALALKSTALIGTFPYDFYPHHFYSPRSVSTEFMSLDKRRVVAYTYRRESVCLGFDARGLHRNVVSTAEFRIDLDPSRHASDISGHP